MGSAESRPLQNASHGQPTSGCPVAHGDSLASSNPSQSCPSPRNQMPTNLSQKPLPGQEMALDTARMVSSIPTADESAESKFWIYPSEQMFFDAMRRKNWNPKEVDMKMVVPIHNAVNERAWSQILQWEKDAGGERYSLGNWSGLMVGVEDPNWSNFKEIPQNYLLEPGST